VEELVFDTVVEAVSVEELDGLVVDVKEELDVPD
jgi:hypothetical protein